MLGAGVLAPDSSCALTAEWVKSMVVVDWATVAELCILALLEDEGDEVDDSDRTTARF